MQCRKCGTEIADKALICYRCGTATAEPTAARASAGAPTPPAPASRLATLSTLLALLVCVGAGLYLGTAGQSDASREIGWGLLGLAALSLGLRAALRLRRRR